MNTNGIKYVERDYNYIPIDVYYERYDRAYCYFTYRIERQLDKKQMECIAYFDLKENPGMTIFDMLEEVAEKNGEEFNYVNRSDYINLNECCSFLRKWFNKVWYSSDNKFVAFTKEEWLQKYGSDTLADLYSVCKNHNLIPRYVDFRKDMCEEGTRDEYVFVTYREFPTRFYREIQGANA